MRLLYDTSGNATTNLLSFAPTWFVTLAVFLMNVQLGRNYVQRDIVDHATAVAADTTMKTYCDSSAQSAAAAENSIAPLVRMVSSGSCQVDQQETGGGGASGGRQVEVVVTCRFPCTIPFASQLMCDSGYVSFSARQKTTAMGCDGA